MKRVLSRVMTFLILNMMYGVVRTAKESTFLMEPD